MRNVRLLLALAAAACGSLIPAAAAAAEPYPVISPNLTASATTVTVGDTVTVFGTGFSPNETVDHDLSVTATAAGANRGAMVPVAFAVPGLAPAQSVASDENGNYSTRFTLNHVGIAVITGTGRDSGASDSVSIVVLPEGGALPVTGNDGTYLGAAMIGSAVAAAGVILVVLARSRRRRPIKTRP
jgi:hypothetical protein